MWRSGQTPEGAIGRDAYFDVRAPCSPSARVVCLFLPCFLIRLIRINREDISDDIDTEKPLYSFGSMSPVLLATYAIVQ